MGIVIQNGQESKKISNNRNSLKHEERTEVFRKDWHLLSHYNIALTNCIDTNNRLFSYLTATYTSTNVCKKNYFPFMCNMPLKDWTVVHWGKKNCIVGNHTTDIIMELWHTVINQSIYSTREIVSIRIY